MNPRFLMCYADPLPYASKPPLTGSSPSARATPAFTRSANCPGSGYTYNVARGDDHKAFPPGTPWSAVSDTWTCPDCAVRDKVDFVLDVVAAN